MLLRDLTLKVFRLCPTTLPAVAPVFDQEKEDVMINLETVADTDIEIAERHFVDFGVRMKEAEVASDREEEIVVVGRKIGKLIAELFRRTRVVFEIAALLFDDLLNPGLNRFGDNLGRQGTQPALEHGGDGVDIGRFIRGLEKVHVIRPVVESSLKHVDIFYRTWYAIETFRLDTMMVQIVNAPIRQRRHPVLGLVSRQIHRLPNASLLRL